MNDDLFPYEVVQDFNETDIRIYKYILSSLDKIPYMTIRELAGTLHLSTSSVLRFCEKVRCEGYAEFKEKLKKESVCRRESPPQEGVRELMNYFQRAHTSAFEHKIDGAVGIIKAADKVIFLGQGSSGALAKYGARYFSNLGKFAIALEDTYYPVIESPQGNTVIVALSESGETEEIIGMVQKYREHGYSILSITNSQHSTLARMSDWNISYNMNPQRVNGGYNATTQIPALFIMETIARRLV